MEPVESVSEPLRHLDGRPVIWKMPGGLKHILEKAVPQTHELELFVSQLHTDPVLPRVQLGGNFKIEEIKIGTGNWQTVATKVPVSVEKTVTVGVVILRNKAQVSGGTPVIAQADVEQDLKRARDRYTQAGMRLTWNITTEDPPTGVDLADGLTEYTVNGSPTAEETSLLTSSLATPSGDDVQIFYVNYLARASGANGSFGEAFPEAIFPSLGGNIIVSAIRRPFTLPHELGHILRNDNVGPQMHSSDPFHLMRGGGTSASDTLGASKRFTTSDETTMRGSKYAN